MIIHTLNYKPSLKLVRDHLVPSLIKMSRYIVAIKGFYFKNQQKRLKLISD